MTLTEIAKELREEKAPQSQQARRLQLLSELCKVTPSTGGLTIRPTATGIEMNAFDGSNVVQVRFNRPHPWLLTIESQIPFTVQAT